MFKSDRWGMPKIHLLYQEKILKLHSGQSNNILGFTNLMKKLDFHLNFDHQGNKQ